MVYKLEDKEKFDIMHLINGVRHELSVECVIKGILPGEIYVDDKKNPKTCLVKTPEGNFLIGNENNQEFNNEIKKYIDYFDQLTPDSMNWESAIYHIHPNIALRRYNRKTFHRNDTIPLPTSLNDAKIELIYPRDIHSISYKNKELLLDWFTIVNIDTYPDLCIGAIIISNNTIMSCSGVDCYIDNKIEIGIKTIKEYRRRGYGIAAVSALINESIKNGITDIGWHCMETNKGSIGIAGKCHFQEIATYSLYSPFPPVENINDLTAEQWKEYGLFFEEKGEKSIDHYWQAARCWAKAEDIEKTIDCINKLRENKITWFIEYLNNEEYEVFSNEKRWIDFVKEFKKYEQQ